MPLTMPMAPHPARGSRESGRCLPPGAPYPLPAGGAGRYRCRPCTIITALPRAIQWRGI